MLKEMIEQIYHEYTHGQCSTQMLVLADELHTLLENGDYDDEDIYKLCNMYHGDADALLRRYGVDLSREQGRNA